MSDVMTTELSPEQVKALYLADMTAVAEGWQEGQPKFRPMLATMFLSSVKGEWVDMPMSRELAGKALHGAWREGGKASETWTLLKPAGDGISEAERERFFGAPAKFYFNKLHRHLTLASNIHTLENGTRQIQEGQPNNGWRTMTELYRIRPDQEVLWLEMFSLSLPDLPEAKVPENLGEQSLYFEARDALEVFDFDTRKRSGEFKPEMFEAVEAAFLAAARCVRTYAPLLND